MGKSSLINFILGDDVCKARGPGAEEATLERVTTEVTGSQVKMNGVLVTIYDSPGLQDGTPDEPRYLDDMFKKCRDVDLIFYCLDMNVTRWTPPEIKSIQLLTEKFGGTFWDKAIIVLTKGNVVRSPDPKIPTKEFFGKVKEGLGKVVREEVKKQVSRLKVKQRPKNVSAIPVVPSGSAGKQVLPDGKHFIGHIWMSCLERIRLDKVEIFMQATCADNRLVYHRDIDWEDVKEKSGKKWLGFIPTKEDIRNAWRAIFRRKVKKFYEPVPKANDEPKYLLYMDKADYELLKKIPTGRVATLTRLFA